MHSPTRKQSATTRAQGRRNVWGHKDWSSPSFFQDSVNPISTLGGVGGADYAHHHQPQQRPPPQRQPPPPNSYTCHTARRRFIDIVRNAQPNKATRRNYTRDIIQGTLHIHHTWLISISEQKKTVGKVWQIQKKTTVFTQNFTRFKKVAILRICWTFFSAWDKSRDLSHTSRILGQM